MMLLKGLHRLRDVGGDRRAARNVIDGAVTVGVDEETGATIVERGSDGYFEFPELLPQVRTRDEDIAEETVFKVGLL